MQYPRFILRRCSLESAARNSEGRNRGGSRKIKVCRLALNGLGVLRRYPRAQRPAPSVRNAAIVRVARRRSCAAIGNATAVCSMCMCMLVYVCFPYVVIWQTARRTGSGFSPSWKAERNRRKERGKKSVKEAARKGGHQLKGSLVSECGRGRHECAGRRWYRYLRMKHRGLDWLSSLQFDA